MTMRSRDRVALAAALLVSVSSMSAAQTCLGVPSGKAHTLGVLVSGSRGAPGDDGGAGLTYGTTNPSQSSTRLEFAFRPLVVDGSASTDEDFNVTRFAGTFARPLGAAKASGATLSGLCVMGQGAAAITTSASDESELGRAPSAATTAYSVAGGAAWAVSTSSSAIYAGPLFGISSASGESAMFTTLLVGGGVRLGRLLLNGDLNMPMGIENAKSSFDVRVGFMW